MAKVFGINTKIRGNVTAAKKPPCPRHQPRASSCGRSFMAYVPKKLHHIAAHHRGEGFTDTLHAKFAEKLLAVVLHRVH